MNSTVQKIVLSSSAVAMSFAAAAAFAQSCPAGFPDKPVNFIVGYGAGGGTDLAARKVALTIEEMSGWTVVVDNKPGASGAVMATGVMGGDADGYTVGVATNTTMAIVPNQRENIEFNYSDFGFIGTGMRLNYGLAALADRPYKTLEDFVEFARQNGRATVSTGSASYQVAMEAVAETFGVEIVSIPTKGSSAALKDALGGHVDATVQGTVHVAQIEAGEMVQLATLTDTRATYAPDAKTLSESGVDLSIEGHIVFFVNGDTPADLQSCLSETFAAAVSSDSYTEFMTVQQTTASNLGSVGTASFLADSDAFYKNYFTNQ
ncbi:tripartite tricarboxylate transporter substrate binding protein [Phaeobacter sp. C3_T13_0]|uniref:tripartite tricarboxylate transporter substrate binding protein n=1 Tax=Phaeobacter cretensis TaxID=3342641 RepID=UPI0039BC2DFD